MKIANILNLLNKFRNFNKVFREDITYDNIKSHKKPGFHPLFRRYIFRKTTEGEGGGLVVKLTLLPTSHPNRFKVKH